ncbi:MAG: hypothetical protein NTW97_02830 [Candidatus Krumholzibacteria bacterium]|nr:hypothetical protein [Candidatus Krumholzibacteria bacterium]
MEFHLSKREYGSLSIRDLIEVRDAYHMHLTHLDSVVATAIGKYRIRHYEPNATHAEKHSQYGEITESRTLENSVVKPWSWPCVLVFVDEWLTVEQLSRYPDQAVPRQLFMADGRVVPTCVIFAPKCEGASAPPDRINFPSETLGGGYPVVTDNQGVQRIGSLGCLTTNGESVFALTNRHVAGEPGQEVCTIIHGVQERIGIADKRQIGKLEFGKVYQDWAGSRAFVNVDAALVKVDDRNNWTAQIFGIGEMGNMIDLNSENLSLNLIGIPVRAFGGVSGVIEGEIQALFYRYRSVGGVDFVADALIGPPKKNAPVRTQQGDSGTIWFIDPPSDEGKRRVGIRTRAKEEADGLEEKYGKKQKRGEKKAPEAQGASVAAQGTMGSKMQARRLRPFAIQWGGERLMSGTSDRPVQFALATFLSTVCRELDVELIRDWNIGHSEYWGKISHFMIGNKSCDLLTTPALRALMLKNRTNIGFDDETLSLGREFRVGRDGFVPLADVPDYRWISASRGRDPGGRKNEGSQHFADMDQVAEEGEFSGKTLLDLCRDPQNIDARTWKRFYESIPQDLRPEEGMLPFRIWQAYNAMADAARSGKPDDFVCAAGILAHYVGDACQPLHMSQFHHGYGPKGGKNSAEWPEYKKTREYKIHAIFEEIMFEVRAANMLTAVNDALSGVTAAAGVTGGRDAAREAMKMMEASFDTLSPKAIIAADDPGKNQPDRGRILWDAIGPQTAKLVASGCTLLAQLWESAWAEGKGDEIPWDALKTVEESYISDKVRDGNWLPALTLDEFADTIGR